MNEMHSRYYPEWVYGRSYGWEVTTWQFCFEIYWPLVTRQCSWLYKPLAPNWVQYFHPAVDEIKRSLYFLEHGRTMKNHFCLTFFANPQKRDICSTSCMQFTLAARNFIKSNSIFFVCLSRGLSKFFAVFKEWKHQTDNPYYTRV